MGGSEGTSPFSTYKAALDYLFNFTDYERMHRVTKATSVFGLSRMNKLLDYCGNPQRQLRAVHIAGTKGKGSTAAMLASMLQAAGLQVGLYTSPHIMDIRERIQINGEWITEAAVVEVLNDLHPYLEVAAKGGDTYAPTFFETFTVIAFIHFLRQAVDLAIIEVGLGGRLDATNVLQPLACGITPISFDHTDKLGNTLALIAGEKAGIVKRGVPVISGVQKPEALDVIRAKCAELDAPLHVVGEDITFEDAPTGNTTPCPPRFSVNTWRRRISDLTVPLIGRHQRENAATAIGLADLLCERGWDLSEACLRSGMAAVAWPARIQTVSTQPEIIIDGAHNPASASVLVDALAELPPKRTVLVFAVAADKDVRSMLRILGTSTDSVVFTRTRNPRAMDPAQIQMLLDELGINITSYTAPTPTEAIALARKLASEDARVVITGSMYLAGEALAEWPHSTPLHPARG